ncbi:MAG TPA: adenylate/guanylate cyclase domain-containing protein [Geminicoccaceae bacterium]|nr:adenylate/guanylate cyclase domain-containing protein [Geminicoccaceae bacterium]
MAEAQIAAITEPEPAAELDRTPEVTAITDWIVRQGLLRVDFATLLEGFCERMVEIGVPISRGYISARTLHPTVRGTGCSWRAGEGTRSELYIYQDIESEDYKRSPFRHMLARRQLRMRLRLADMTAVDFPLVERLRRDGGTDYLAHIVGFGIDGREEKTGVLASWTTKDPRGFSSRNLALLDHMMPRLALALSARLGFEITVNLLDTYVGPEAGRRILNGEIRRGMLQVISAVIFYADLRGFTSLVDNHGREEMVAILNDYFDCVVPVVGAHGGQVLKFLGDGLLATFPLEDHCAAAACEHALDAAAESLRCVRELNDARAATGRPTMELDLVLHLGDLVYGNVGGADRLDFTVVGPAVNEASRIEALCAQHGLNLLVSEAFARGATRSADRLVSIGRFMLRGVRSAQSIYTLDGL